jgi:D-lyxose ketol-isomerase
MQYLIDTEVYYGRVGKDKHLWGSEARFVNTSEYCGKLIELNAPNVKSSLHYHKEKKETFIVLAGEVFIEIIEKRSVGMGPMLAGEQVTIYPGQRHRFWAENPALIMEVSTHHEDDDTFRLEGAGM